MSERWDKLVWDDLIPHVEDDLRIGAFEMKKCTCKAPVKVMLGNKPHCLTCGHPLPKKVKKA